MADATPKVVLFTGFQLGGFARAIHEYLRSDGNRPKTLEQILQATHRVSAIRIEDAQKRAEGHLTYWEKRGAYLRTSDGWLVDPGVQFYPSEYSDKRAPNRSH